MGGSKERSKDEEVRDWEEREREKRRNREEGDGEESRFIVDPLWSFLKGSIKLFKQFFFPI